MNLDDAELVELARALARVRLGIKLAVECRFHRLADRLKEDAAAIEVALAAREGTLRAIPRVRPITAAIMGDDWRVRLRRLFAPAPQSDD
jgi:hypothetical protein